MSDPRSPDPGARDPKACSFIWSPSFRARWDRLKLPVDDLRSLEGLIQASPKGWVVVPGSNGMRKVRFSPPSLRRGKSGAYRVFYLDALEHGLFFLITIIDKGEEANLTRDDVNHFAGQIAEIKRLLRDKK